MKASGRPSRRVFSLLDIQSVAPHRPAGSAIRQFMEPTKPRIIEADVLIAGGGTGGVAAAIALSRLGKQVCLVEETDWLGGQFSSQGVSALDEHDLIESFGGTSSYYEFRRSIRKYYLDDERVPSSRRRALHPNPGEAWVSRLCFEPGIGHHAVQQMLENSVLQPRIFFHSKPYRATVRDRRVTALRCCHFPSQQVMEFRARYFLDATELGDLLELCGDSWMVGAEARDSTGEPDALAGPPQPDLQHSFTYPLKFW